MEALASRITTCRAASEVLPEKYGRARARTTSRSTSSCSRSSQLWRRRWKGALAWVSARNFCQSRVLGTSFTTRFRLSR